MPKVLSDSLVKAAREAGIDLVSASHDDTAPFGTLTIQFLGAMSRRGGNGGHNKYVEIAGWLSVRDQEDLTFTARRKSGGGAMGWMKSACTVFDRINKVLAEDIVTWLRHPENGVHMGDPHYY